MPLPPGVLKIISPNTYQLYKTTSPGWPDGVPFYEPNQQLARMDTNPAKSLEQIGWAGGSSITNLTETTEALAIQSDRGAGHQFPMTTDKRPMTNTNDKGLMTNDKRQITNLPPSITQSLNSSIPQSSIVNPKSQISSWRSLSIYRQASKGGLYKDTGLHRNIFLNSKLQSFKQKQKTGNNGTQIKNKTIYNLSYNNADCYWVF